MQINNLVVARYLDGRTLKGMTRDFSANRPGFHVEVAGTNDIVELRSRNLKAVFFVRSLDGDPSRQDLRGFVDGPAETAQGRKIAVRFRDGEFLCGYTLSWSPDREGFFLFPSDPGSNNQRVYVVAANTDEVKSGPQAEKLAERMLAEERARDPRGANPSSTAMPRPSAVTPRPAGTAAPSSAGLPRPIPGPPSSSVLPRPSGILPRGAAGVHDSGPSSAAIPRPAGLPPRSRTDAA